MHSLSRLLVERDRLVGIGLMEPTPFPDLGADLGIQLLGRERLGVLHVLGRRLAVLLRLFVRELREQAVNLFAKALIERVTGRGNLDQQDPRPTVISRPQRRQSRLVQAQCAALLSQIRLSDQLVGLGVDAKLAVLGFSRQPVWPPGSCRS